MANRLASEKSRYLLQHAENIVDWYPWGEEAFSQARSQGKPLLISIGYSSCHWCHVMAHESFESEKVAGIINDLFVAVKVDKEEFPDIDGFYMSFLSKLIGSGGWPLNVFVNPNGAPFFGLTYRDPAGFGSLLEYVSGEYAKNKTVREQRIGTSFNERLLDAGELATILSSISFSPSSNHNGPQFPQGLYLALAWREGNRELVASELENLVSKGLFDHIEGGWFRYSVDPEWKVPHFEKMLYDQATLLGLCTEIYDGDKDLCGYAIGSTARWLREHMLLPNGLYGSATDADTKEGEGFYYTIEEPRSSDEVALFRIVECGRHEDAYLPWIDLPFLLESSERAEKLIDERKNDRKSKIFPTLDKKAVFSWNAYLAYALKRCAVATGDAEIQAQAIGLKTALDGFVQEGIHRVYYSDGSTKGNDYLEDWASWLLLISSLEETPMEDKIKIVAEIDKRFYSDGRIWHTAEKRFENQGLWQDTPFPSGGGMLLLGLVRSGIRDHRLFAALRTNIAEIAVQYPSFYSMWLSGFLASS